MDQIKRQPLTYPAALEPVPEQPRSSAERIPASPPRTQERPLAQARPVSPYAARYKHLLPQETREKLEKKKPLANTEIYTAATPPEAQGTSDTGKHTYPVIMSLGSHPQPGTPFNFDAEQGRYRYTTPCCNTTWR